eukprot:11093141-Alexandrium_andersonii.AAC.1
MTVLPTWLRFPGPGQGGSNCRNVDGRRVPPPTAGRPLELQGFEPPSAHERPPELAVLRLTRVPGRVQLKVDVPSSQSRLRGFNRGQGLKGLAPMGWRK